MWAGWPATPMRARRRRVVAPRSPPPARIATDSVQGRLICPSAARCGWLLCQVSQAFGEMPGFGYHLVGPAAQFVWKLRRPLHRRDPMVASPCLGGQSLVVDHALAFDDHVQSVAETRDEVRLIIPPRSVEVVRQTPADAEVANPGDYSRVLVEYLGTVEFTA